MNANLLLMHYERIADAPNSIGQLRSFILELAVRGKLLPSPSQWSATTLGEVGEWGSGGTPLKTHPEYYGGDIPWLVIGDLNDSLVVSAETHITSLGLASSSAKLVEPGTVLVAMYGSIGKLGIAGMRCATNQAIAFCNPDTSKISREFLMLQLRSMRAALLAKGHGVAQQNISQKILKAHVLALPPLNEQNQIVLKVDELMALCDRLESARAEREAVRDRLTAASLARLNKPDPDSFQADARFSLKALPALTTRPDQIKQLRQTILSLAVRGKLVPQDPNDKSAALEIGLVEKLKAEQFLKKPKKVAKVENAEQGCSTPRGWVWARWDQITDWITYGFTRPMEHVSDGVPIVTGKNVNAGQIIFETASLTPRSSYEALNEKDKPRPGDILITKDGSIGRTAIVEERHLPFCINQSVAVMWLRSCHFDRRYLKLVLDSPQTQEALLAKTAGVAIKHISITDLGKMVFPLPPLVEQHRIIAKVDALMTICDRLEANLNDASDARRRLLDALLADALAGNTSRREAA